jgi:hypothetical protein
MTKRVAGTLGTVVASASLIAALFSTVTPTEAQQTPAPQLGQAAGAAAPTPPCGPREQLPANFSTNVDPKSRCFELRIYTVDQSRAKPGFGINELHQRFREGELALFKKHGAEILGTWQSGADSNTLVWMLAYRDRAHREEVWKKFREDPDWKALVAKYPVPVSPNTFTMSATDYSAMK